jgi:hypothetical protein
VSVSRFVRRVPPHPAAAIASRAGRLRHSASGWSGQAFTWTRSSWVDIAWVAFVAINLAAMRFLHAWQTVPFLAIWVSLTVIYGFRLWRIQPTILTLAAVTIATGGIIGVQVLKGQQDADYLAEVPLIASWSGTAAGGCPPPRNGWPPWRRCSGSPRRTCGC